MVAATPPTFHRLHRKLSQFKSQNQFVDEISAPSLHAILTALADKDSVSAMQDER
jgi:hypothetical protein